MTGSKLPSGVVDTNLFVSGSILKRGNPFTVLEAWRQRQFLLVTSEELTAEIADVLNRPEIKQRYNLTDEEVTETLVLVQSIGLTTSPIRQLPVEVRDPKDRKVLAAALSADADYLVTGDDDLLALSGHPALGQLKIRTPRTFLDELRALTQP
jgi:putative PIN family toxin of toxin-antitoxin system